MRRKSPAQLDREIAEFLVEQEEQNSSGFTGNWKVTDRLGSQADADRIASWNNRMGGRARVRRAHQAKGKLEVGQQFDYLGQTFEIRSITGRKNRTVSIARPSVDRFGKVLFIDARSFPEQDFDRQHLKPIAKRHHQTKGDATAAHPTFKVASKDPATMAAAAINKELDKIDEQNSVLGDAMIAAGRGYERPSEYLKMDDPLSRELRKLADRRSDLQIEVEHRYGGRAPRGRLPAGRGYGPRK